MNVLLFIFVALRLDDIIQWPWTTVFIPLWIVMCLPSVAVLYYFVWTIVFFRWSCACCFFFLLNGHLKGMMRLFCRIVALIVGVVLCRGKWTVLARASQAWVRSSWFWSKTNFATMHFWLGFPTIQNQKGWRRQMVNACFWGIFFKGYFSLPTKTCRAESRASLQVCRWASSSWLDPHRNLLSPCEISPAFTETWQWCRKRTVCIARMPRAETDGNYCCKQPLNNCLELVGTNFCWQ